jgi:long-chain fatty acid transport protein
MGYDEYGPQRYSLINSTILSGYLGPSLSQRIAPWLTIGVGAQYSFLSVSETLSSVGAIEDSNAEEGSDDPNNDVNIDVATMDPFGFGWNAGLIVQPLDWLEIGLSYQSSVKFSAPGSLTSTFNPNHIFLSAMAQESYTDDDVTLNITLPMTLRGGIQVHPSEKSRIEADVTWTQWSALPALLITDMDLVLTRKPDTPLLSEDIVIDDDIVIKTGFQDGLSVRLGGDYLVAKGLTLRAGGHYEASAVNRSLQGQSVVDGTKLGLGLGATWHVAKRLSIDIGAAEQVAPKYEVTDSQLKQVVVLATLGDPPGVEVVEGKAVGNGTLASHTTFIGVGATLYLGAAKD